MKNKPKLGEPEAIVQFGEVIVDRAKRTIVRADEALHLTPREYHLLTVFLAQPGKSVNATPIVKEVWGRSCGRWALFADLCGRLRQKLEIDPTQPKHLLTETGVGYRFML